MPRATSGSGLPPALVSIPTLFNAFGVIAFAIGVAIHGF
jgi:hypothetical protein